MGPKLSHKIILLLAGILLTAALAGCSTGKASFQEVEHPGAELYSESFAAHVLTVPQFTLRIHDQIYEAESAQGLYDAILADYAVLSDLLAANRSLEITLIPETPDGEVLSQGEALYCTPEDVLEGDYHAALVRAYTGFDQPWKLIGVEGLAFGKAVDQADLVDYYSDEENLTTLSLFPAYFVDSYTDRTTLSAAQDTAVSFTDYILTNAGAEALYQPIGQSDYRQAWLDSLGITTPWQLAFDLSFLDDAQFSSSEDYPVIITTDNRVYSFKDNAAEDPRAIMQILVYFHTGWENLITIFQTEAPVHYAQIEGLWKDTIHLIFDSDFQRSYIDREERTIYFASTGSQTVFYSTFYFLFPESQNENQIWKQTGMADYVLSASGVSDRNYYAYFVTSPAELEGDNAEFLTEVQAYYSAQAPFPETVDDFDFGLFYEAMAMIPLLHPSLNVEYPRIAEYSIAKWTNQENKYLSYSGNSLTYPQAYLFTKYLVETYGLDTMLTYYETSTTAAFENIFGLSYSEAFVDFRAAYGIGQ